MKTTTLKFFSIALLSAFILNACSKSSNNNVNKSKTELLTQKAWKIENHGLDENNNGVIEGSENSMLACEADDVFSFYPNGTGLYSAGAVKCGSGDPSTMNFNWLFVNNETELSIFGAPEKISVLNELTLEVYYEDLNTQGQTVKYIRRFKH